jgi:hypothetical protein
MQYKYKNILLDLFYHNIPTKIISGYPIAAIFKIKKEGENIIDLTKKDLSYYRSQIRCEEGDFSYNEADL